MNKGELYNLLSKKKSLSKDDINSVLKGGNKIDPTHLDEFDRDAMEGWKISGADHVDMSKTHEKLGFSGSKLNLILAAIVSIFLLSAILWPYLKLDTESKNKITTQEKKYIEETDIFIAEKFDTLIEVKKKTNKEIVSLKKTQQAQPKIFETTEDKHPLFEIEELPTKPVETTAVLEPEKISNRKKIKEVYFHTFKLVDYRSIRNKPRVETRQMNLTGTAANLDSISQKTDEVVWQKIDVPYIDYVEKTMFFMDKGNLKKSLARFDVILETYSDDINALFYSGFAYYNLNELEKAQIRFEEVLQSNISNFDEEAMWYLGLTYDKLSQNQKAKVIFKRIAESNSFYSELAKKKL